MKSFSPMTREEKLARRCERDRAAYARDPEKFRKLSHENRLKPGAGGRHKEYVKAWVLRNVYRSTSMPGWWGDPLLCLARAPQRCSGRCRLSQAQSSTALLSTVEAKRSAPQRLQTPREQWEAERQRCMTAWAIGQARAEEQRAYSYEVRQEELRRLTRKG